MRRALYRSSAAVDRAVGVLRGALGELERAMGEREDDWCGARVPRMVTNADLEAAKAAQRRRLARGEGWGEGQTRPPPRPFSGGRGGERGCARSFALETELPQEVPLGGVPGHGGRTGSAW